MLLRLLEENFNKLKFKKEDIQDRMSETDVEIRLLKKELNNTEKCMFLLEYLSKMNQEKIVSLFEGVVSKGLKDLFDDSYEFKILQKSRGSSSAAEFQIECSKFPGFSEIIMCHGKSIQDVIAIILRLILVKLDNRSRKIVILDEPTSGLEIERQKLASKFLKEVSEKFGIQIIIVTHSEELALCADKEVRIGG